MKRRASPLGTGLTFLPRLLSFQSCILPSVLSVPYRRLTQDPLYSLVCAWTTWYNPGIGMLFQEEASVLPWLIPGIPTSLGLESRVCRVASHSLFWLPLNNEGLDCSMLVAAWNYCVDRHLGLWLGLDCTTCEILLHLMPDFLLHCFIQGKTLPVPWWPGSNNLDHDIVPLQWNA